MPLDQNLIDHIQNMVCPIYGIHPIVEEDWDGIKVSCCCKEFEKQCLMEVERLLKEDHTK